MEWLSNLFLVAFFAGLLFTVGSVLLGVGHTGLHDLGIHLGGGADGAHADGGDASGQVSPWNLSGLTGFGAWFGGVGYLALNGWQLAAWLSLLLALVGGVIGWGVIFWFYSRILARGEGTMQPEDYRLDGVVGTVTVPLGGERIGEIQFNQGGGRRSAGARSADGSALAPGTEVVIVRYERGIAYVEAWEAYVQDRTPEERPGGV